MNLETSNRTQSAHHIITNPNDFTDQPILRAAAWAAMMTARNNAISLNSMAYTLLDTHRVPVTAKTIADTREQIETALDETTPQNVPRQIRIKQRVCNHALTIGHTMGPHGGDAA
ncbi:hypothetical protein [Sulfitobacter sp.]|uniref:hypothetical protein n=1 Tax=Sulfitobacter sp. TaxID=1903071 RepID=UPI003002204E